ncbi:MAG: NADH-quinone oxidoreductase subunit A [Elusimicrobium sp.]|jgi:NADH-quinone oxidoreductase subunit A|nr:NADH-quinone oxidoreductase subunit A [Elusimicrobium sp.]
MANFLLFPPVIFIVAYALIWLFSKLTAGFAPKPDNTPQGKLDPYACGEEYESKKVEPDYKTFFPFAIFFTVIHVAGLMIATLAASSVGWVLTGFAVMYVVSIAAVFAVLYSK